MKILRLTIKGAREVVEIYAFKEVLEDREGNPLENVMLFSARLGGIALKVNDVDSVINELLTKDYCDLREAIKVKL